MKKLIVFLPLALIVIFCSAQIPLNVSRNTGRELDKYAFQKPLEKERADMFADTLAMDYIHYFSQAIDSPGKLIVVQKNHKIKSLAFFKKLVEVKKQEIIYDGSEKIIRFVTSKDKMEKTSYLWLLISTSLILMIVSNVLFVRSRKNAARVIAFIVACIIFAATFDVTTGHFIWLICIFLVLFGMYCADKISSYSEISAIPTAIIMILCFVIAIIGIIYEVISVGFIFVPLLPSCAFAIVASCEPDHDDEEEKTFFYARYAILYYILMIVQITSLFIVY